MSSEPTKQNLSAAYELLKQWTDISEADTFEELGRVQWLPSNYEYN